MRNIITAVLLIMTLMGPLFAMTPADSIRREMKTLSGKALLQAHCNLCRLASAGNDLDYELRCVRDYLAEAIRQEDVEAEGLARVNQLYCYYNYDMIDSLFLSLPGHLEALKKNKTWEYYYSARGVLIEQYLYEGKLQTALREAEKTYADARETDNNYGLGVSAYMMGSIYQTMARFEEAETFLRESIDRLSKEEDISELLSAYNALCETLDGLGKYDTLRGVAEQWGDTLDKYKEKTIKKGNPPSLNGRYLYQVLASAVAEIGTGNYAKAEELLHRAESLAEGRKPIAQCKLLEIFSRYYVAQGMYDKAIEYNDKNMEIMSDARDSLSLLTVQLQRADLLMNMGDYKESALLYREVFRQKDKLRNAQLTNQLDELRTLFEVDKLKLRNKISTNLFYSSMAIGILLLIILFLYMGYSYRLKQKNRILYNTMRQQQASSKVFVEAPVVASPGEGVDSTERLYHSLCTLMEEEKLFKEPQLNREVLAEHLGTNHVYLAEAIRKYAGDVTVGEFINRYRLNHAASLLAGDPGLNVGEVEYMSGFNSRSTFSRLFRERYGMSPSEYRKISKEKKN